MDKEAWHAAVHEVTKSQTQLSDRIEPSPFKEKLFKIIQKYQSNQKLPIISQ